MSNPRLHKSTAPFRLDSNKVWSTSYIKVSIGHNIKKILLKLLFYFYFESKTSKATQKFLPALKRWYERELKSTNNNWKITPWPKLCVQRETDWQSKNNFISPLHYERPGVSNMNFLGYLELLLLYTTYLPKKNKNGQAQVRVAVPTSTINYWGVGIIIINDYEQKT